MYAAIAGNESAVFSSLIAVFLSIFVIYLLSSGKKKKGKDKQDKE